MNTRGLALLETLLDEHLAVVGETEGYLDARDVLDDVRRQTVREPFAEGVLATITERADAWDVICTNGDVAIVPRDPYFQTPVVGEVMQLFGRGHGHRVDRIVIGGRGYR